MKNLRELARLLEMAVDELKTGAHSPRLQAMCVSAVCAKFSVRSRVRNRNDLRKEAEKCCGRHSGTG